MHISSTTNLHHCLRPGLGFPLTLDGGIATK
jgi:hypothetical protein